ncbi:MAG: efflux RND transporter periplasmic adaptor subunit [Rhodospirillaceae bacterium]|nr:efflux RND transporter periplasmic adaptor subunit [Rhodospirillaceae bacterium]
MNHFERKEMYISKSTKADHSAASTEGTNEGLLQLRARRKKARLALSVAGVLLVIGAAALTMRIMAPTAVTTLTVAPKPAERVLAVTGRVKPQESVQVYARAAGQIVRLNKDEGDLVQAGDVLGQIDPARATANLTQAKAALDAQRRVLAQAERDLERAQELLKRGSTTQAAVETATLAVTKGREDLRRLEAVRDEAQVQLGEQSIIAPFAGRILNRPVDPGQVVSTTTALFSIAPTTAQEVEAEVDESYSMSLKLGQSARLAFAGVPEVITGTLSYLAPEIQTSTGGRLVRFAFTAPESLGDTELPVGLSVDVNVIVDKQASAITLPRQAIRDITNKPYVLTVKDGAVARQDIGFIDWPAPSVIVTKGVTAGDDVIMSQKALPPGTKVSVEK